MLTALGLLLLFVCISIHELGHAFSMRKNGVEIEEICLFGLGGPKLLSFRLRRFFGETAVTVRPLIPLGAFVKRSGDVDGLPKCKQVDISSAGIEVNLYFGFALIFLVRLSQGDVSWLSLGLMAFTYLCLRFAKPAFIISCGILFFVVVVYSLVKDFSGMGSVVAIVDMIKSKQSVQDMLMLGAAISVSVGLFNTMPLFGLDGYWVLKLYVPKKVQVVFNVFAVIGIIAISFISLGNDFVSLFS